MNSTCDGNVVQYIQLQKAEKSVIVEQLKKLEDNTSEQHQKMYSAMLGINAEIANKFFKDTTSEIAFSSRMISAVTLMENETKRLELGMDMPDTLESELGSLKEHISQWRTIQANIYSPIKDSSLFLQASEVLSRTNQTSFSSVDDIIRRDEPTFFENVDKLSDMTLSIVQMQEAEMTRKIDAIDQALRDSVQRIAMGLEQQCDERKGSLHQQRLQHRAELDTMYNSLLQDFLTNAQSSSDSVTASYRALERQKPLEISEHAGAEDKSNNPVRPPIWKSEVDALFLEALREDERCREVEAQLDDALIEDLSESQIEVLDHGMDEGSLVAVIDKLTELYVESSEIDAKLLKR